MSKKPEVKRRNVSHVDGILDKPRFVEDLPTKTFTKGSKYAAALTPLLKHKNKWAVIAEFSNARSANSAAVYLRANPSFYEGKYEFSVRTADGDKGELYARYIGR